VIVGTPSYLPPEQALGKDSDARSDLYSLGCVLYEMVTGRAPFPGDDPVKVIFSHINDVPVMPRRIAAEIPEALEQVILKLLSKDPDRRYQSAGELLEALKSVEVTEAAPAGVPTEAEAAVPIPTPEPRWAQPLVNREEEVRTLRARLDAALRGEGGLVFVTGEAGIGKTRLAHELRSYARLRGAQFLTGRGYQREGATPYRPWVDIINEYLRWAPSLLLFKVVGTFAPELAKLVPEVTEKLGTIPPSEQVPPQQQRPRLFQAVTGLFTNISKEAPLVLFLDDLQWADEASLELLHHVAQNTASERVMVVGAYRDLELEDQRSLSRLVAGMNRERLFHPLPLKRLGSPDVSRMVTQTFGEKVPPELGELVYGRTEGNPFFVEEVLRSLVEEEAISPTEKGWEARDLSQVHIPRGITAVVQDRLERLDEECRQALAMAAVIGREFGFPVLREVSGVEEDRLVDLIDRCLQARLVVERHIPGEELYAFADTQVRDVLYEGVSPARRRRHHLRVGEVLEKVYAKKIDERVEELAHHSLEGNDLPKAVHYSIKAGDKAAGVFSWQGARKRYETVLGLLEEEDLGPRAGVLQKLTLVTFNQGDADASLRYGEPALELYEKLGDKRNMMAMHRLISGLYFNASGYWDGAREDMAVKHLEAAAALAEADPDSVEKGLVYQRTAHMYLHRGQPVTALPWAQRAVDMFARLGVFMGTCLGTALTYTGRIDEGIAYNEKNCGPVLKAGNPVIIAIVGHELTLTLALVRDVPRAQEWGERTLPEVTKPGGFLEGFLRRPLALTYALSGEVGKAEETCQAQRKIDSETLLGCFWEDTAGVGFHYLHQGEWDAAREYLEWAIAVQQDRNQVAAVGACSFTLGSLNLELGNYPEAEELLLRSLDICRKGGNVLFELWVLPVLCELHLKMGQAEKAAEYVDRGLELLKPDQNWYGLPAGMYLAKGMLATTRKEWDEAEKSFDTAIAINRQYELPWDEAKALYEWGLMHLSRGREGDRQQAGEKIDEALTIFQKVGAKKEVEKVLGKKGLLGA
jgi:tetratricopeptide (TPR) repeat protein